MISFLLVLWATFTFFIVGPLFADKKEAGPSTDTATTKVVDTPLEIGNKICPVSGEKIEAGKENKVVYKGKVYNLCCKMCEKDFKKDPQKYIDALKADVSKEKHSHKADDGHHDMHDAK